jgi:hypothetical protein
MTDVLTQLPLHVQPASAMTGPRQVQLVVIV